MKYLVLIVVVLLSACTTTQPDLSSSAENNFAWKKHQKQLDKVQGWHVKGRMAVANGSEYWSINLDWEQYEDTYIIYLSGPFGAGNVKLMGSSNGVILTDSDKSSFFARDPDELLYQQTGVKMPVASLRYWILGMPEPGHAYKQVIDEDGRLENLDRNPWHIQFKRYTQIEGLSVPDKIFITKGQDLSVRMIIADWELNTRRVAASLEQAE